MAEWSFASTPNETSHADDDFCDPGGRLLSLDEVGVTIDQFKDTLLERLSQHRKRMGEGVLLAQKGSPFTHHEHLDGHWWAHRPKRWPAATRIKAGTRLTGVGFYRPMWGVSTVNPVRMHSLLVFFDLGRERCVVVL